MHCVYVIKSDSSGKIYIGRTDNFEVRLSRHNKTLPVKTKSYTYKNNGPWKSVLREEYMTRQEALAREKELKSHKGRDWLKIKLETMDR